MTPHHKPQQFVALAVAALVSLVLAVVVYTANTPWSSASVTGGKLAPGFASTAANASTVEITQGQTTLTIDRSGTSWTIRERDGYPASAEKIRRLIGALADAELVEPKTRLKDRFPLLELEDPGLKNGSARLIRVLDKSGSVLAETIAGKQSVDQVAGRAGTYVRKPAETQSWLSNAAIQGGTNLRDWADPRIFEMPTETISKLSIELSGEPAYDIKFDGNQHVLTDIPAGKKIKYINATDTIIEAASFLDFENVRKKPADQPAPSAKLVIDGAKGLKVMLQIRRNNDGAWMTLEVSGDGDAAKAAEEINARAAGWEFEILPSKANTLMKRKDDLLEDAAS